MTGTRRRSSSAPDGADIARLREGRGKSGLAERIQRRRSPAHRGGIRHVSGRHRCAGESGGRPQRGAVEKVLAL